MRAVLQEYQSQETIKLNCLRLYSKVKKNNRKASTLLLTIQANNLKWDIKTRSQLEVAYIFNEILLILQGQFLETQLLIRTLGCCIWNRKVPGSNPARRSAGLRYPTSLRGSR